jgi:microcystin-dependent protein
MAETPLLGTIFIFAGNFAPTGYMLCQGQVLPIAQYAALFAILGTTYGGNGTSNFALPNLQGRAPIGQGTGAGLSPINLGQAGGANAVTILSGNMPAHNHLVNVSNATGGQALPSNHFIAGSVDSQGGGGTSFNTSAAPAATLAPTSVSIAGSGQPLSVQNPYLGLNYIIAMVGVFPSRS